MRLLLTGSTGLVGQGVLRACLRDDATHDIVALVRTASRTSSSDVYELVCPDFADLRAVEDRLEPFDACLYCAGAQVPGAREADYRHVTFDLTTHVARTLAQRNPGMRFLYVSGAASDPDSRWMPLRVKGETEVALAALPLRATMLRPGAIQPVDGVHSPHKALDIAYTLGAPLMGLGVSLLPKLMTTTEHLGRAMLQLLRMDAPPAVVENAEINALADQTRKESNS